MNFLSIVCFVTLLLSRPIHPSHSQTCMAMPPAKRPTTRTRPKCLPVPSISLDGTPRRDQRALSYEERRASFQPRHMVKPTITRRGAPGRGQNERTNKSHDEPLQKSIRVAQCRLTKDMILRTNFLCLFFDIYLLCLMGASQKTIDGS